MAYEMNRNTALPALSTVNASPYNVIEIARMAVTQMAAPGVRCTWCTCLSQCEPGSPPSRAKAYIMREQEVTAARPHTKLMKNISTSMLMRKGAGIGARMASKNLVPIFIPAVRSGMTSTKLHTMT